MNMVVRILVQFFCFYFCFHFHFQTVLCTAVPRQASTTSTDGLEIQTNGGIVVGFINQTTPGVRQFLGVPYASPPTGQQRWLAPSVVTTLNDTLINATLLPPSCPQYASKVPTVYNRDLHLPQALAATTTADQYAETSEDCLTLAIWTPVGAQPGAQLPVVMFVTGGAFVTGGINIAWQLPYHWVQRTQAHIVVTINYRLNIFGFPNARGLDDQNLAMLDQRMALEWVRDNIQAFGGDSSRITLWGQSAGAVSVDYLNFAYPSDPIASGWYMDSGSVFLPSLVSEDSAQTNFTFVASQLGCGGLDARAELDCMRGVDFQTITNFVGGYTDNRTLSDPSLSPLNFLPVPDEKVVFRNYTRQYESGAFANVPAVFSTNANEGAGLVPYPANPDVMGPDQDEANLVTLFAFQCPAGTSAKLRAAQGRTTYRWFYAGNFTNVSPRFWMGAYHSSDLPMTFGTHQDYSQPSTDLEFATSYAMQDHLLAFAQDPLDGPGKIGWQSTAASNDVPKFGADGQAVSTITSHDLNAICGL